MNRKFNEQHLFEIKILCNIIRVFTVTFNQLNASLLNHFFIFIFLKNKNLITPKF